MILASSKKPWMWPFKTILKCKPKEENRMKKSANITRNCKKNKIMIEVKLKESLDKIDNGKRSFLVLLEPKRCPMLYA
jgi:hypothetical protein